MAVKSGVSLSWGGFDKALGKAAHKLANTQPLMETIGEVLVSGTLQRFQDEEDPDGKKWKPSIRAMETGDKTLSDTGRLQRSIDYAATSDKVMVGTNVVYGRIHQMGGIPVDLHHDKKRKRRLLDELLKVDVHEPGQFLYRRGVLEQYLLYARGKGLYYVPEDGMEHPLLCPEVIMKSRTCDSGRRSNVTHTCLVETLQDKKRLCRLDNPSLLQGAVL